MTDTLRPVDAVWLMMESDDTPMHVGVLATFRLPARGADQRLQQWAEGLRQSREIVAPWNCRLADPALGQMLPRLLPDTDFDLDYHFRHTALPAPGGERELGVVVSRLHSQALDRNRPLWELHLIEGLEGKRFALYLKIHHALVDNVNAVPLVMSWLADSVRKRKQPPLWAQPIQSDEERAAGEGDLDALAMLRALSSMGQASTGFFRSVLRRNDDSSFLMSRATPRSTLNRRINSQRRFATQQLSRARIEALAKATDSTRNDILAYLCSSSLRRFFKEYNALPDKSLIAGVPVSLAERSESLPGNAIAGLRVELATHLGDPLARLAAIKRSMRAVREDRDSMPEAAATSYVMLRAAPVYASQMPVLGRLVPPLSNLTISNTPMPGGKRYLEGATLEAIYPVSPLMQFAALSIDCVAYDDVFNVGFTGARDTLPHLQRLAVYTGVALDDLEALVAQERASA